MTRITYILLRLLLLLLSTRSLLYPFILREQFSNEEIKRENFQRVSMRFDAMKFSRPFSHLGRARSFSTSFSAHFFFHSFLWPPFSHCHGQLLSIGKGNRPLECMPVAYTINLESLGSILADATAV